MSTTAQWRVITPTLLEELPSDPGVFEIANLVRTVLFIGAAPCDLATTIREAVVSPRLMSRSHCIRFELADDAEARAGRLLAAYRQAHGGLAPYAHRSDPLTNLLDARRPPPRALPLSRPGRKSGPAAFLRSRPGS